MTDEAPRSPNAKFDPKHNPYRGSDKENEESKTYAKTFVFSENRKGRDRSKSKVYSEFQRMVPALMEYEVLRHDEFHPQIAKTHALLSDLLEDADRLEALAKQLSEKVIKVQEDAMDARRTREAAARRSFLLLV